MKTDGLTFVEQKTLTIHEARMLSSMGFILKFIAMHLDGTDTYEIWVRS